MRRVQITAGAQRAFEWFARRQAQDPDLCSLQMDIRIHPGTGECRCSRCEAALKQIDRIVRASK